MIMASVTERRQIFERDCIWHNILQCRRKAKVNLNNGIVQKPIHFAVNIMARRFNHHKTDGSWGNTSCAWPRISFRAAKRLFCDLSGIIVPSFGMAMIGLVVMLGG